MRNVETSPNFLGEQLGEAMNRITRRTDSELAVNSRRSLKGRSPQSFSDKKRGPCVFLPEKEKDHASSRNSEGSGVVD